VAPYNAGFCDDVLGRDGSKYSASSTASPFILNGIEMMVGGYAVLANQIINYTPTSVEVWICNDCSKYSATPTLGDYEKSVFSLSRTNNAWQYISEMDIDFYGDIPCLVQTASVASSSTRYGDAMYTKDSTASGFYECRAFGYLGIGAFNGLAGLSGNASLSNSYWNCLARLSTLN
jgi:hypothetical protein